MGEYKSQDAKKQFSIFANASGQIGLKIKANFIFIKGFQLPDQSKLYL